MRRPRASPSYGDLGQRPASNWLAADDLRPRSSASEPKVDRCQRNAKRFGRLAQRVLLSVDLDQAMLPDRPPIDARNNAEGFVRRPSFEQAVADVRQREVAQCVLE